MPHEHKINSPGYSREGDEIVIFFTCDCGAVITCKLVPEVGDTSHEQYDHISEIVDALKDVGLYDAGG